MTHILPPHHSISNPTTSVKGLLTEVQSEWYIGIDFTISQSPVKGRVKAFAVGQIILRDKIIRRPTMSLAVVPHPASGERKTAFSSPLPFLLSYCDISDRYP